MNKRALLVIDLQVGVESNEKKLYRLGEVIKKVNEQINDFRQSNRPIIFVQHEDEELVAESELWQLFPELNATKEDYYVGKTHANSFYKTGLSELLEELGIDELEICGAQTEYCVDTTIRMAHGLGYRLFMRIGTATTTDNDHLKAFQIIKHHEAIWDNRFLTFI